MLPEKTNRTNQIGLLFLSLLWNCSGLAASDRHREMARMEPISTTSSRRWAPGAERHALQGRADLKRLDVEFERASRRR